MPNHPDYYLPIMPYLIVPSAEVFIAFIRATFDAEEKFGVSFDGEEVKGLRTVGDIVDYMSKHPPAAS